MTCKICIDAPGFCSAHQDPIPQLKARIRELEQAMPTRCQIYDLPTIVGAEIKEQRWHLAVAMADRIEAVMRKGEG